MKTYAVMVENSVGLYALHCVEAYWPSDAKASEEAKGFTVLAVWEWGKNPSRRA